MTHDPHPSPPSSPAPRSPPDRWGSGPWQPRRDGQVGWCGTGGCGEQCRPDSQWHPWILKYNVLERLNCLQSRILPISTTSVIVSPAVSKFVFFRNCWKRFLILHHYFYLINPLFLNVESIVDGSVGDVLHQFQIDQDTGHRKQHKWETKGQEVSHCIQKLKVAKFKN